MPFTEDASELDDSLHPLDLALDDFIEVLFLDLGEHQEVNRPGVAVLRVLRDELT